MDIAVCEWVEPFDLAVVEITVDPSHVRRVGMLATQSTEPLPDVVVEIRKRLENERDIAAPVERLEVGLEKKIDSLSRKCGADVEERAGTQILQLERVDRRRRIRSVDPDADNADRDGHTRVPQDVSYERRHHPDTVQVSVEVLCHILRYPALFPTEVLARERSW